MNNQLIKKFMPAVAALTVAIVPVAASATIVVPTYVSGTNVNSDTGLGFDPANTTTNGGLSVALGNGATLAAAQGATFSAISFLDFWETISAYYYFDYYPAPSLVFDLGSVRSLSNLILWQSFSGNDNQLAGFSLRYSSDGTTFADGFSGTLDAILGTEVPTPAQTFALGGISARYVELTLTSNQVGTIGSGGDRVGFGKIRFDVAAVPEPASWAMMILGFGLVGVAARRRRTVVLN